ncbi:hypothetical protein BH11CYA1_BH11CYA1_46840 [soil metagenome]
MASLAVINELMEIYKTYRPTAEVASQRNAILQSLDVQQFEALQTELIARNKCGEEAQLAIVEDVMSDLLSCSELPLDSLLKAQLEAGWTPLDYLFRGAGEQAEKELWTRLKSNPTLALSALAWVDKPHITAKFVEWKNNPPDWLAQLPLETYSHQAGWELNLDNEKRWLFSKTCYGIRAKKDIATTTPIPTDHNGLPGFKHCLWCKRPIFAISNLASKYLQELFGIALETDNITIPFCQHCTNFGAVPMQLTGSGATDFSSRNDPNRIIIEPPIPLKTEGGILQMEVESAARNPYCSIDSGRSYNLSQIGGFPTCTQFAQFPKCTECTKTMLFLMQVESMDFPILNYEGVYHIFVCEFCYGEFAVRQAG